MPWRNDVRPLIYDVDELATNKRRLASDALPAWHEKYSEVTVRIRLMPSTPAHALIAASADAQLVVVGSRGRGALRELASGTDRLGRGLLLGSVARQVIHHAHCPVAVVREPYTV